jgi:uncharacterized protein (TIGR02001 family)
MGSSRTRGPGGGWAAVALLLAQGTGAVAQSAAPDMAVSAASAIRIGGAVALASDYRFRGISRTDIAPAIQPALQLDTASGLFVGFWGSNVADFNGATTEIDLSAGWSGTVAGLDTSVGVLGYLFLGGSGTDVVEVFATVSVPIGPLAASLGLNWAPDQANAGASRYAYAALSAALPGTPFTLQGSIGNERGGFVSDDTGRTTAKWDWTLGLTASLSDVTLGIAYVGTDLPGRDALGGRANSAGRDGLVLTLSADF